MADYTLDAIIREHLLDIGDSQLNKYAVTMQRAVAGLRELNMDVSGTPTVVELEINSDLDTVNLPVDYIQYVRIGLCGADGNFHSLGLNGSMCLPRTFDKCSNPTETLNSNAFAGGFIGSMDGYADNFRNGELTGRFFGLGGGFNANGYYRIDKERGTINLSALPAGTTSIVLEYLSSLRRIDGKFQVHPFIIEALKAWIWWKSIYYNPNRSLAEKDMAQRNYYTAKRWARRRFNTATFDEYKAAFRGGDSLAPKF